jgi:phenylalanyl-tRNA synthetase alpha subunit
MDSMTTIENNNTALVEQLTEQLKTADTTGTSAAAIETFKAACDKAVETYVSVKDPGAIPKNDPITGEDLQAFNNEVSAAANQLNAALASDTKWNKLEFSPFTPTVSANLRFQVEQLKCKAIINAM